MCSDQGMWKHDGMVVFEQIAVWGNKLTMRRRTEAVVWFLNFALAVEMDMGGEESLIPCSDVDRGGGSYCCS